jgi:hypothetical protein
MLHSILNSLKTDSKYIIRNPKLLSALLAPFMIIIFLKLFFPLFSNFIYSKTGFLINSYYSLVAITFISIVPALIGMMYARIIFNEKVPDPSQENTITAAIKRNLLYMRMIVSSLLSFILVLITIILTKPVPTEGWLRTLFAVFLLSIQSVFVFLFIGTLAHKKIAGLTLSNLYWFFLVVVPLGLLLHHPWNYFAFFSPLYWVAWAWIVPSALESLVYGTIAVFLSVVILIILSRGKLKETFG